MSKSKNSDGTAKRLANLEPHKFKKGQSGNPKGRTPKLTNKIINELYEKGYERITTSQVKDCYLTMLNLEEEEIKKIEKDKKAPMIMRIVAKEIIGKRGFEAIETLLQRAIGQPKQDIQVSKTLREVPIVSAKEYLKVVNDSK